MGEIIQDITLEVAKPNLFQAIVAKQTDYGSRFLRATLANNGEKIFVDPTFSATINAKRPDGLSKRFDAEVNDDGTITAPLTGWMLEKAGIVDCDISMITPDAKLSSTVFSITVNEAACGGDVIEQDEDLNILTELINEVTALTEELEQKAGDGEFKGDKGDPGPKGDKGDDYVLTDDDKSDIARIVSENYGAWSYDSQTEELTFALTKQKDYLVKDFVLGGANSYSLYDVQLESGTNYKVSIITDGYYEGMLENIVDYEATCNYGEMKIWGYAMAYPDCYVLFSGQPYGTDVNVWYSPSGDGNYVTGDWILDGYKLTIEKL